MAFYEKLARSQGVLGDKSVAKNVDLAGEMIQKSQTDAQALKNKIAGVQTTLKQFLNEAPR